MDAEQNHRWTQWQGSAAWARKQLQQQSDAINALIAPAARDSAMQNLVSHMDM